VARKKALVTASHHLAILAYAILLMQYIIMCHLCLSVITPHYNLVVISASAKINVSYSILFNLTTSYSSYFGGKKGISRNKTSFFLLMPQLTQCTVARFWL